MGPRDENLIANAMKGNIGSNARRPKVAPTMSASRFQADAGRRNIGPSEAVAGRAASDFPAAEGTGVSVRLGRGVRPDGVVLKRPEPSPSAPTFGIGKLPEGYE